MKTAIVGSGVAGLAMANALATSPLGQDLVLLEQRMSAATEGFAFLLMPNGLAALRRLLPGLSPSAHGRRMARLHIHRADGALLVERPLEDVFCVSRKALLEQLLRAAGSLECRYSARAAGLRLTDAERRRMDPAKIGQPIGELGWVVTPGSVYYGYAASNGGVSNYYHDPVSGRTYQDSAHW